MKFQVSMNLNESFFYPYYAFVPMCWGFLTRLIEQSSKFFKKKWRHRQDSNLRRQSPMPLYLSIAGHRLNHSATVTQLLYMTQLRYQYKDM